MTVTLRVMSYNIRTGRGLDSRVDLDRIADVIAAFDPDIVALQEVDVCRARTSTVDQPQYLAKRLGMDSRFAPAIVNGSEHYGIATLSRLRFLDDRQIALPYAEKRRRAEPRCALVTRFAWPATGTELELINTHLSVVAGERPAQVDALACALTADEVLIAGDFNCTPWSRSYRVLCGGLRSATGFARSWHARLPIMPLDHILFRGPLDVIRAGAWSRGAARQASDHLPVFAELAYARGAA